MKDGTIFLGEFVKVEVEVGCGREVVEVSAAGVAAARVGGGIFVVLGFCGGGMR